MLHTITTLTSPETLVLWLVALLISLAWLKPAESKGGVLTFLSVLFLSVLTITTATSGVRYVKETIVAMHTGKAAAERLELEARAKTLSIYIKTGKIKSTEAWWTYYEGGRGWEGSGEYSKLVSRPTIAEYLACHSEIFLPAVCKAESKTFTSIGEWLKESGSAKLTGEYVFLH